MEKKTIGKFISVLRRAHGMTQQELGDRLFVSDKTVSRWERDESTPELSLIPVIAEIFGITTDELLRGEKNSHADDADEQREERQRAKSEKQFKLMLDSAKRKYDNYSLISVGIAVAGILAAIICNFGFIKGVLGFGLACACFAASVICQICFSNNARLTVDDEDEYADRLRAHNVLVAMKSLKIYMLNGLLVAFCLPIGLLTHGIYGLEAVSWLGIGTLFAVAALLIEYVVYHLALKAWLIKKGVIEVTEKEKTVMEVRKKMLIRCGVACVSIVLVLVIVIIGMLEKGYLLFAENQTIDDPVQFAEFMQSEYDDWIYMAAGPNVSEDTYEINKRYYNLYDPIEQKWIEFYYPEERYDMREVDIDRQTGKVTFLAWQDKSAAQDCVGVICVLLMATAAVTVVCCVTVYAVAVLKAKKRKNTVK